MLVDSHCHLDFPDLVVRLPDILQRMQDKQVAYAVCIGVNLEDFPKVQALSAGHANLFTTVGVHPEYTDVEEPDVASLISLRLTTRLLRLVKPGWITTGTKINQGGSASAFVRIFMRHAPWTSRWSYIPVIRLRIR